MGDLTGRLLLELPPGAVVVDPDVTSGYRRDMAGFCEAGEPAVLVFPETVEQVRHVLRTATELRVPVVPQGARTGLSGGANAVDGCILLSLVKMDRILEIDPVNRIAVVQPGVVNAELSRAVAEHGLAYPPDPSSWESCTIGGNIGTGAGGLCCVKYGVTSEYVLGLDVVLPDGRLLRTGRRTAKGVAGYDLTRLLVGSEGTLGVVVQAVLALRPAPAPQLALAAEFPSADAACAAVCEVMARGFTPSLMELMDSTTVRAVNAMARMGLPDSTQALLLVAFDTADPAVELAAVARLCRAAGATEVVPAEDPAESELLLQSRRLALPALDRLGTTMIDDVAVPRSRMAEMLRGVAEIAERHALTVGVVCHAGDGNTHPVVVFDADDPAEVARARQSFDEIMALGLGLGGTITGEHGVGLLKRDWLARELGPVGLEVQCGVKAVFDPLGIMNPGKTLS
ncbi:FAD-linked oxidase C-terminal domain-containing protein [Kitasatospora sp. MAP5-34]|uniref:FAD-binding oxidoreductase n=1 Tax=Kitasatospora sp. MAP5-34 TaxID=3035102 RepID=UPI0024745D76|nr:FAD-linked oxidase C-terminal domain-containing protein [Kitasatospora sp. MAP5-34]MDH6576293.1 glycolate oxidase [Kitasatospora sp. MAP5-34]